VCTAAATIDPTMTVMAEDDAAHSATVFVVDDDPSVRRALSRLFASVGLRVETYAGPEDFLTRVPRGARGCIVLDVKMPGVTGIELQDQLPSTGIDLPIIFVTAHADVPMAVRAMKQGAVEVFTKPFQHEALLESVRHAIARDDARFRERLDVDDLRKRYETLTPRERTVMELVVTGLLNKQVAAQLGTSIKTVKVHRAHVVTKMGADSLPDLVRMAVRLGVQVPKVQ
jgi:FixJ family two-component response regulator